MCHSLRHVDKTNHAKAVDCDKRAAVPLSGPSEEHLTCLAKSLIAVGKHAFPHNCIRSLINVGFTMRQIHLGHRFLVHVTQIRQPSPWRSDDNARMLGKMKGFVFCGDTVPTCGPAGSDWPCPLIDSQWLRVGPVHVLCRHRYGTTAILGAGLTNSITNCTHTQGTFPLSISALVTNYTCNPLFESNRYRVFSVLQINGVDVRFSWSAKKRKKKWSAKWTDKRQQIHKMVEKRQF